MHVSVRNNKGFSLVELMVVVAIIGILAAIAVPNFQRFSAKSKQSEAKANLSMLYASEASFYGEWQSYTGDMGQIGYRPQGVLHFRITNNAFNGSTMTSYSGPPYTAANVVTSAAGVCSGVGAGGTGCVEQVDSATSAGAKAGPTAVTMIATAYTSSAAGTLVPAGVVDEWTVTQFKVITNSQSGLP